MLLWLTAKTKWSSFYWFNIICIKKNLFIFFFLLLAAIMDRNKYVWIWFFSIPSSFYCVYTFVAMVMTEFSHTSSSAGARWGSLSLLDVSYRRWLWYCAAKVLEFSWSSSRLVWDSRMCHQPYDAEEDELKYLKCPCGFIHSSHLF